MRSAVANGVCDAAHLWSVSGARRVRIWCILFFSAGCLFVSCAPTMKDLPKLQQTMQSPDESARVSAVKDLGRMRGADPGAVVPLLTDSLGKDASAPVRAEAARSLTHYPGDQAATALGQALKSDISPTVRAAAADAVGTLNLDDAFALLKGAAMTDSDTSVRQAAVTAMANVCGWFSATASIW